jgi:hypothetical protein
MGFGRDSKVVVEQIDDTNWMTREELRYEGKEEPFVVPAGSPTDFASVPRVFVWLLPRYGRYTKAAILHDHLWRDLATAGEISWVDADATFRRAMRELGVPFLRRWLMWAAVRWAALLKPGGTKGWSQEAWRVVLLSAVALPIVVPPAATIVASLGIFYVVEWILWVPLQVNKVLRRRAGKPSRKAVNPPELEWKAS